MALTEQSHHPCAAYVSGAGRSAAELSTLLRAHDIYFAPWARMPSALGTSGGDGLAALDAEAIATRLPTLYKDEGAHPESFGLGGVRFHRAEEVLPGLRKLVDEYAYYSMTVGQPLHRNISAIAADYIDAFRGREPGTGTATSRPRGAG